MAATSQKHSIVPQSLYNLARIRVAVCNPVGQVLTTFILANIIEHLVVKKQGESDTYRQGIMYLQTTLMQPMTSMLAEVKRYGCSGSLRDMKW